MITANQNEIARLLSTIFPPDSSEKFAESLLGEIAPHAEKMNLRERDILIRQGDSSFSIYYVMNGRFHVMTEQPDGSTTVVAEIGPGEPIGEIQALTGGVHTANVQAATDSTVIKLSQRAVEIIMEKAPETVHRLLKTARMRLLRSQLAILLPSLFDSLDDEALRDIQGKVQWHHLRSGEMLFREGDPGDRLYIVILGRLRVTLEDSKGEKIINEVARGEIIGEMALFSSEPRSATVYAVRDCDLVSISQPAFDEIIKKYPQVMRTITKVLINRLARRNREVPSKGSVTNITVIPASYNAPVHEFSVRLSKALSLHGKVLHITGRLVCDKFGTSLLRDPVPKETLQVKLAAWLDEQETKYPFIIYEADPSLSPWTLCCLSQADQILALAQASDTPGYGPVASSVLPSVTRATCSMVILHPESETLPSNTGEWLRSWNAVDHQHVHWDITSDIERVARYITNTSMGLVLSGGGARGFAHIGVIRALREGGIPIDMIGGTSMGAVIASAYALGWDDQKIYDETKNIFFINNPLSDYTFPIVSFFRCRNLDRVLENSYGDTCIEDLWIRYFCISTNLSIAEIEIHDRGSLWKAVRASISYPGIAVPVVKGNHLLIDGGVLNNLPIDIMKKRCRGSVIAVDVSIEEDLTVNYPEVPSPWRMLWDRISPVKKYSKFPNILDILTRTAELSCINRKQQTIVDADLYLRPPVDNFKLLDFKSFDKLVDIGYAYAKEEIKKWDN